MRNTVMGEASFGKRIIAVFRGVFAAAGIFASQAAEDGSLNTLAHYDPSLLKATDAFGPLFSKYIPRSSTEQAAPGDFVEQFEAPDGSGVRVLVKAPAPAEPGKILKVASIASGESANDYFDRAIKEAISGGYAAVMFPKAVYNFVAPPPTSPGHWLIKGAKDLTTDGQGATLNFASPVVAGVTIGSSQRVIFKNFNIDWPNELMASVGTIATIDRPHHTIDGQDRAPVSRQRQHPYRRPDTLGREKRSEKPTFLTEEFLQGAIYQQQGHGLSGQQQL
jgi:hypothetical protein